MRTERNNLRVVTLEQLKMQLRVDFDEEDELIIAYGMAAEDVILRGTERTDEELRRMGYEEREGNPPEKLPEGDWWPQRLCIAVLLLAAHYYRNREPVASVAQNAVPYAVGVLTKPYRKLTERRQPC